MPRVVIKKSGEKELYQPEKVANSLRKIGAEEDLIKTVLITLDEKLPDVVTTKKLYREVFNLLSQNKPHLCTKYNLKNAIYLLGPSGYPFEKFFAKILDHYGYETKTNLFLAGKCLTYEIDILAKKEGNDYLIECKFHQFFRKKEEIKNILYVYARYLDLKENYPRSQAWLVTNTKFTSEVIKFAECYNIKLTSWNWPKEDNLFTLIEKKKLYPITILTKCQQKVFREFIKVDVILVEDLIKKDKRFIQKITNLNEKEVEIMLAEAGNLLRESA